MKNEVNHIEILKNHIEGLKCYNNILKNNAINEYEFGWMKTIRIELNDYEFKMEFEKYLHNIDLNQKEKYITFNEFVKWINICYKLDTFKIQKIVQDYIDVKYERYKAKGYRASLNPILKINRMIRYYNDLFVQLNLLETPEPPPQLTKDLKTDVQKYLFNELKDKEFIDKYTDYDHFCYVFGNTIIPENKKPFIKITWKKAKYDLRDLLFYKVLKSNFFITTQIEQNVSNYFQNENNQPLKLRGNKKNRTSQNYEKMQKIIQGIQVIQDIQNKN